MPVRNPLPRRLRRWGLIVAGLLLIPPAMKVAGPWRILGEWKGRGCADALSFRWNGDILHLSPDGHEEPRILGSWNGGWFGDWNIRTRQDGPYSDLPERFHADITDGGELRFLTGPSDRPNSTVMVRLARKTIVIYE